MTWSGMRRCVCGSAVVLACCAHQRDRGQVQNVTASPYEGEAVAVTLPAPGRITALPTIMVGPRSESIVRVTLCSDDGRVVDVGEWAEAFESGGIATQVNTGGWRWNGPMAMRFRAKEVIGDMFANADARGCRHYIVRCQLFPRSKLDTRLAWSSAFGDTTEFSRCIRFFATDARFPFSDDEYAWGCPAIESP